MIRQLDATYDQPAELTATDRRMQGAETAGHANEVMELREEIRRAEALVARTRAEMGDSFFMTIQHAAHLDGLRKELGAKIRGPETAAERELRLDNEADEGMDQLAAALMGRGERTLDESADAENANGPKRQKTENELDGDADRAFGQMASAFDRANNFPG